MDLHSFALNAFYVFLIPVIAVSFLYYSLGIYYLLTNKKEDDENFSIEKFPYVTIQIPVYNDNIVVRCIEHCANFDYPKDRYEIQVVDDSDDERTLKLIDEAVERYKNLNIYIIRRNHRKGFKAGALNNAIKYAKGEIFVIFDSDFCPEKDFLKRLIAPMVKDNEIAAVQARMGFLNAHKNLITKFAAGILMVYNTIVLKITSKKGITFLEGTGMAVRKEALIDCGYWNENSITEDADLTLKLLEKNYKIKFLENLINPGEVPFTLRSFLRQQMRWSYGMIKVGIEYRKSIFSDKFSLTQKIFIASILYGGVFSFFVLCMTFFAILAAITGRPDLIRFEDIMRFLTILILTFGFAFTTLIVFKHEVSSIGFELIPAIFFLGIILSIAVSVATIKAGRNKEMWWYTTQKSDLEI